MATIGGHSFLWSLHQLYLGLLDEAGDLGALRYPPAPNDQPVLVVAGLFVHAAKLATLTHDYLDLKHRFFPNLNYRSILHLDRVLPEITGAEFRKHATRGNARQRRHGQVTLLHVEADDPNCDETRHADAVTGGRTRPAPMGRGVRLSLHFELNCQQVGGHEL